jgi:hypothetical protein
MKPAMQVQVAEGAYRRDTYASLDRFIAYHAQIELIRSVGPSTILFVGIGDGMVPDFLKKDPRYAVTTFDIDASLRPDTLGDVRALPFGDKSFDLVCAFEVLEHMPFGDTKRALGEIARVAHAAAVSLPHRQTGLAVALKFPFIRSLTGRSIAAFSLLAPVRFPGFAVSGQHYWEIDWWTTSLRTVRRAMREQFRIRREFTPPLDHYHRFFLLDSKA